MTYSINYIQQCRQESKNVCFRKFYQKIFYKIKFTFKIQSSKFKILSKIHFLNFFCLVYQKRRRKNYSKNYSFFSGGGPLDAEEVKRHKFFTSINWDDLLKRNIPAPFIPRISSMTDVSNFSEEFTSMPPVDSPRYEFKKRYQSGWD